ncbi:MAG: hypothetical protein NVSMB66_5910 [Candidatus Doudnabacteria bacterium]
MHKIRKFFKLRFIEQISILFAVLIPLLLLAAYFSYQPSSVFYGNVFTSSKTNSKVIALTFDDGPNDEATLQTLNILKSENVKATFFVVGDNVSYYPAIAKKIVTDGHEIENHSTHHTHSLQFETKSVIYNDLVQTNKIIMDTTGMQPRFYRPPFGFRTPWALKAAIKAGLIPVTWSDLTQDYSARTDTVVIKHIEEYAYPGGIIVLHDGFGTQHGVQRKVMLSALPKIIEDLKSKGYTFVTIAELYDNGYAK